MFAVSVLFSIKSDKIESFREVILRHAARTMENEPGCLRFDVGYDPESPADVFLYELYEDREAFAVHSQAPYLADFFDTAGDWIESKQARRWDLAAGSP